MQNNCMKTSHKIEQGEISTQELLCLNPGAVRQLSWTLAASGRDLNNSTCLLRNLYADQEETARTGHGTTDWFQMAKGVR